MLSMSLTLLSERYPMNSFVFLSSRFLSPLDREQPLDPLVEGSCTRRETLEISDLDPQPFLTEGHLGLKDEIGSVGL